MAGSLLHITDENGKFTMESIENMGDAHEALEDCFSIILALAEKLPCTCNKWVRINEVLDELNHPKINFEEMKKWAEEDRKNR